MVCSWQYFHFECWKCLLDMTDNSDVWCKYKSLSILNCFTSLNWMIEILKKWSHDKDRITSVVSMFFAVFFSCFQIMNYSNSSNHREYCFGSRDRWRKQDSTKTLHIMCLTYNVWHKHIFLIGHGVILCLLCCFDITRAVANHRDLVSKHVPSNKHIFIT